MFELQKKVTRCYYKCGIVQLTTTYFVDGVPDHYAEVIPHKPSRERWWANENSVVIYVPESYGDNFDYVFENRLYLDLNDIKYNIEDIDTSRIFINNTDGGMAFSDINGDVVYLSSRSIYVPETFSSGNRDSRTLFYQIIEMIENSDIINMELVEEDGIVFVKDMYYNPTSNPLTISHFMNSMMEHTTGSFSFKKVCDLSQGIRIMGEEFDMLLKKYFDINGR